MKEKAADVPRFVADIRGYGALGVDMDAPDRGNDALRKAKYIVRYRPEYFSVAAIGMRMDFAVAGDGNRCRLFEDMAPFASDAGEPCLRLASGRSSPGERDAWPGK